MKIASAFFLSMVKFMFAPSYCILVNFTYLQTLFITTVGGIFSCYLFYNFGEMLFNWIEKKFSNPNKKKKIFTPTNRKLVLFIKKYGLIGLAVITPAFPSLPVGSILASKYFKDKYKVLALFSISVFTWSLVLTTASYYFKISID